MSNIYLTVTAPSGGSYAATIERLVDNYYREDDAEVFGSGLSFSDKDITLTEGSNENRGTYTKTFNGTSWNDGVYRARVHDTADNNNVISSQDFSVLGGEEVAVGEDTAVYHADIQFIRNTSDTADYYLVNWFKNGVKVNVVSTPRLSVFDNTGALLLYNSSLTSLGSGVYSYDATGSNRQTIGRLYHIEVSGIVDSEWRKFSWNLGRDL